MPSNQQGSLVFFGPSDPRGRTAPSMEWKRSRIDRSNPSSPFAKFVGNERAIKKLQVAAFQALGHPMHLMRDISFAIFGPASAGKTTLARIYAETVQLPFVEVSPKSIQKVDDLFDAIDDVLRFHNIPLIEETPGRYRLPPCVIFIDEVHALTDSVVQGLLKATEFNDAVMATESGKVVNTFNATWMIATTDEGKLFDAFRTRFNPVQLKYLTKPEVAKVIKLANPDLDDATCELVAHYNPRVPRKALEFARLMRMYAGMEVGQSMADIAQQVAEDEGIDRWGMHEVYLKVLKALKGGPVSRKRMATVVGRKDEEVERYIMPFLLTETDDQPALVSVSRRGYQLTAAGEAELRKRELTVVDAA
jgi:Holliday junction resolvasome RuvABC ATP-dependent DNA helicase subunit